MALVEAGLEALQAHSNAAFERTCTCVGDHVWHYKGFGHSNVVAIEAESSLILVDALDSPDELRVVLDDLERRTGKSVKTLIYTHGHPDHRGGAGALRGVAEEIIAFAPCKTLLPHYDRIARVLMKRGRYQHGYGLTAEEAVCQGIGPREGKELGMSGYDMLGETTVYLPDDMMPLGKVGARGVERTIDGVRLQLIAAPGETDDALMVYLPGERILACGDLYYSCWPNLYAIRGTQYRDVSQWIESLGIVIGIQPVALLPGHMAAVIGEYLVLDRVCMLRDAMRWVFDQTLRCIDEGLTLDQTVEAVVLPEPFASDPDLREFYGTVEWSVKSIYTGYVGWFDGDPSKLVPVGCEVLKGELFNLIGEERLANRIDELMGEGSYQLALELMELVPHVDSEKWGRCLRGRADQVVSANARHYLISAARFDACEEGDE